MKSTLLENKSPEEILQPTPRRFIWDGETYDILPMPDSALMVVADALSAIAALFDGIAFEGLGTEDLLPLTPDIIKILLPHNSKLIAASLRVPQDRVENAMPFAKKLEALRLIILTEDIPLILANFGLLVGVFKPLTPASSSTEAASTNSSPAITDGP